MRTKIRRELQAIQPWDAQEQRDLADALAWLDSGAPLCRVAKPALPPQHLVSYFVLLDEEHMLLVEHRNAGLWLPTGGHVEPGEHPRAAVVRELQEELGLQMAESELGPPLFITITETVGLTAGHRDVSLWYLVKSRREVELVFEREEFHSLRWFSLADLPLGKSDPQLGRFVAKLRSGLASCEQG
ncbi:NUDIX hydrolase [Paucibacter sp. KBW04]|uniref:NUDIX domain-containing protein n=1 Tax=Paucibacter sp. KBW04 TaxID=2153361 RepID=UPI000F582791|nr:NUDIX hydrolase [Paucibacter sp. KBW04]RQO60497.1 NUDIX hydrolase [Paucibacter sp. KBW04]